MTSASIKHTHGLTILSNKHKAIRKIRDNANIPEIHGDKVWYSSYLIMDYLLDNPIPLKSKVMEIGCGWGILSIFCAKEFDSKVIGVDADSNVIPFLKLHASKNSAKVKTKVCRYENLKPEILAKQDLIVGGDICFWDELIDPLFSLIKRAIKQKVGTVIIADPGRAPFLELAKRCQNKYNAKLIHAKTKKKDGYLLIITHQ
jgi:predicted nicotinamide N-methyase